MDNEGCSERENSIRVKGNRITEATEAFLDMVGFQKQEIVNKCLKELEQLLRVEFAEPDVDDSRSWEDFIFMKNLRPRKVRIKRQIDQNSTYENIYFESANDFSFEDRFCLTELIIKTESAGAIVITYPGQKIIRANESGIKFAFGSERKLEDMIGSKLDSNKSLQIPLLQQEKIWDTVILRRQTCEIIIQVKNENGNCNDMNTVFIPLQENNELKYLLVIFKYPYHKIKIHDEHLAKNANIINRDNNDKLVKFFDMPMLKISYPSMKITYLNLEGKDESFHHMGLPVCGEPNALMEQMMRDSFLAPRFNVYIEEMVMTKQIVETGTFEIPVNGKNHLFSLIYKPCLDIFGTVLEFNLFIVDKNRRTQGQMSGCEERGMDADFLSYMAHEMKAPLTVIHSAIQLIDFFCRDELSERAERFIGKIRQSAMQQLRLVNNFLDITKMDSGYLKLNRTNVDIVMMTKAIVNAVSLICDNKRICLKFESDIENRVVSIDDEKYERMLLNILSNAIKFTPSDKCIHVKIETGEGSIKIRIKDEGIGIPLDMQQTIFEKFGQVGSSLTRESEGTGLGLCLAKMLAKAHGGDILLKSRIGEGSEFSIVLPDICLAHHTMQENAALDHEDRLVQSVKVEFSNIYM